MNIHQLFLTSSLKKVILFDFSGPLLAISFLKEQNWNPESLFLDLGIETVSFSLIKDESFRMLDSDFKWQVLKNILMKQFYSRTPRPINSLKLLGELIENSKNILVVTGAGISTSCGIPDFRSSKGIYSKLRQEKGLADPESMFDIECFRADPRPFFSFAREIFPGNIEPSLSHRFIKLLQDKGKLLRNYTQNIDTLENVVGLERVFQCHGSFATATCLLCGHKTEGATIRNEILGQEIPRCPKCPEGIMKPDIVFFGEALPKEFDSLLEQDIQSADLLIVMGSSLKVYPVAHILDVVPPNIPQVLINRDSLPHRGFDMELLGDCDQVVSTLSHYILGWNDLDIKEPILVPTLDDIEAITEGIFKWPISPDQVDDVEGSENEEVVEENEETQAAHEILDGITSEEEASDSECCGSSTESSSESDQDPILDDSADQVTTKGKPVNLEEAWENLNDQNDDEFIEDLINVHEPEIEENHEEKESSAESFSLDRQFIKTENSVASSNSSSRLRHHQTEENSSMSISESNFISEMDELGRMIDSLSE